MTADEAKAVIDKFAAADSSMASIAAVAKQLIDQVAADAVTVAERERKRAYRARGKAVPDMSRTGVPDTVSARARSSSSSLREDLENGGGGDTRARPLNENVSAEQLTDEVERIVKENGHWPPRGWVRSATVEQIERRLRLGQKPLLIVDAVTGASKSGIAVGQPIYSFTYFDQPIARAHGEANKRPSLPLDGTGGSHAAQRDAQEFGASVVEQLRRNIPGGG